MLGYDIKEELFKLIVKNDIYFSDNGRPMPDKNVNYLCPFGKCV